ncbi:hypothetical protein F5Y13DRAFT_159533 [Hypoxylon sp. FL1857]|nr:hypothetical protein F5Y13DRAFT_159533 [Hypoxylon sp. FL1857]
MSSIGPQLPPTLTKRKRTPDDESPESPAAKQRATDRNKDEVDLSSDDEDDYGPSAPKPTAKAPIGPIGPDLPPSNADEINLDDSDDDDIGPSAPPPPTTRPSIGPTLPPLNQDEISLEEGDSSDDDVGPAPPSAPAPAPGPAPPPAAAKRVHGPAPPPAPLSERPPTSPNSNSNPNPNPNSDSDSDSEDDDYGPALPTSSSHIARQTQARRAEEAARAAAEAAGPQRDDWMLAPPTSSGYRAPDPTKLKNRRFQSGPRSSSGGGANAGGSGEISSIWTETPEQKRKRLENAVLGRESASTQKTSNSGSGGNLRGAGPAPGKESEEEDAEQQARIRSFTEATRGKSLYEEHQQSRKGRTLAPDEEEDDPSKRAFDREKDMKLGGRIGTAQRRELLNRAADFGGRFAKGKYL